jgi:hypothetical protein
MPSPGSMTPVAPASELSSRWLVQALCGLGLAGVVAELAAAVYLPRLLLFLAILALGLVGLARSESPMRGVDRE